jgi:hypothetical protein
MQHLREKHRRFQAKAPHFHRKISHFSLKLPDFIDG